MRTTHVRSYVSCLFIMIVGWQDGDTDRSCCMSLFFLRPTITVLLPNIQ